jgi:hypothetical protein
MALRRNLISKTAQRIEEHWTADLKEELEAQFNIEQQNWPTAAYGTAINNFKLEATGHIWHATFTRQLTRGQ